MLINSGQVVHSAAPCGLEQVEVCLMGVGGATVVCDQTVGSRLGMMMVVVMMMVVMMKVFPAVVCDGHRGRR